MSTAAGRARTAKAREISLRQRAIRATEDPVILARAARIVRTALERKKLTLADVLPASDEAQT